MITISEIVSWSYLDGCHDDRSVISELEVPVGDLRRAVRFYERVFGFRRDFADRSAGSGSLVMATATGARLVLKSAPPGGQSQPLRRWAFLVVGNLDDARARVWELGVKIARDSGAPDHIYRRHRGGSLYVHDRDGNEIELVETRYAAVGDPNQLVSASASPY